MAQQPDSDNPSGSEELVARVNMVDEEEPETDGDWPEPARGVAHQSQMSDNPGATRAPIVQVVALGLIALAVIGVSMFLMLQGVFEMIPD